MEYECRDGSDGAAEKVLRARGIEKAYGSALPFSERVDVLTGADLTVEAGELVGIVDANGSGKSTLLRILVGDLAADAGTVECAGRVGWCPQETRLYDRLTVRETFALFGEAYGLTGDRIAERRDALADRLDFERFLDRRVDRLSGGNRQKVNLGVALLPDPDVLLLDEPYTGFDWETYLAFWELTDALRERGTATVIISHFVEERDRFDRGTLFLARLAAVLTVAAAAAVLSGGLVEASGLAGLTPLHAAHPLFRAAGVSGLFLGGVGYGLVGALAGAVLDRLPGTYVLLFAPTMDGFLLQSPLTTDAPAWADLLPASAPVELAMAAAYGDPGLAPVGRGLALVAVLAALATLAFYRRIG